jgi:hypothetical protein
MKVAIGMVLTRFYKTTNMKAIVNKMIYLFLATILTLNALAQNSGGNSGGGGKVDVDVNLDKGGTQWYQQTWVWIVGGAVFILLLVALIRGGGSRREEA